MDTIGEKYDVELGMLGDSHLDTALNHHNVDSLHELIEKLQVESSCLEFMANFVT